jgi:hypothetical protein
MHCKMTCILYKKQTHFSQLFCLQVRSVTPWQSHDRKSRCLRGRRHSSILYSPSTQFWKWSFSNILLFYLDVVWFIDGQNHEILKPAISGFYIRFHPVYRPWFYFIRKHQSANLRQWPHDSHMTGRAGVWEADDIVQFYIALLDFFPATL